MYIMCHTWFSHLGGVLIDLLDTFVNVVKHLAVTSYIRVCICIYYIHIYIYIYIYI